jgi:two-component system OmpR family sensor kinase
MSLRLRLLLAVGAIAAIALSAASASTYAILSANLTHRVDETLSATRQGFVYAISHGAEIDCTRGLRGPPTRRSDSPPFPGGRGPGTSLATQSIQIRSATGMILAGQDCPAYVGSKSYRPQVPAIKALEATLAGGSKNVFMSVASTTAGGPPFRIEVTRLSGGRFLIQGIVITDTVKTLDELVVAEVIVSLLALVIALVIGWIVVGIGLRPLNDVSSTAGLIAGGDLDQRVLIGAPRSEIGRLGRSFNSMVAQIQRALADRDTADRQLRQFIADASHELRTPLASVAAYAQLLDGPGASDPGVLERAFIGLQAETARMESLVEDLLVLARLDEGIRGAYQPVELVRLCASCIREAERIGPEWPTTLVAESPLEVLGDEGQLGRCVANLLANVRKHTEAGTQTVISVIADGPDAVIEVHDDGAGMDDVTVVHAFDRFFRGDPSRTRARGGAGLGL